MTPFIIRVTEQDGLFTAQINPRLEFRTKEITGLQTQILQYEGPYSVIKSDNIDSLVSEIPILINKYLYAVD